MKRAFCDVCGDLARGGQVIIEQLRAVDRCPRRTKAHV